jgi:chromosomal replication initiator protein
MSERRGDGIAMARQIAMYLARHLTPASLPEIGRRIANRDHTTVLHAVRKIKALDHDGPGGIHAEMQTIAGSLGRTLP